jgi:periplasmic copper chaperone A
MSYKILSQLAAISMLLAPSPSWAHATFETGEAKADTTYKGVLRVPHGCNGQATHTVRIQIPEGVIAVKPMPKPGWTLTTTTGTYTKTYDYFGTPTSSGVTEIIWSGGSLPDEHYDEFTFRARLTGELKEQVFFPVIQECASASQRWTEIPSAEQDAHALKSPAPSVKIIQSQVTQNHASPGGNQVTKLGSLIIEAPWSRATPKGAKVAGGYMKITNTGMSSDRLIGGNFPIAGRFEVHEMSTTGGIMRMRQLEKGLEIPPGATVELKPGGYHAMFMDMKRELQVGEVIKGTLIFEKAGTAAIEYKIAPVGAASAGGHSHH